MAFAVLPAWDIIPRRAAQIPPVPSVAYSSRLEKAVSLVMFLGAAVIGLDNLFIRDHARRFSKTSFSLPLVVLGVVFFSLAVPLATYGLSGSFSPQASGGGHPDLAVATPPNASQNPALAIPATPKSNGVPTAEGKDSSNAGGNGSWVFGEFLGSLNKAFANALRMTFVREVPDETASPPDLLSGLSPSAASATRPPWVDAPPSTTSEAYEIAVKAGPWKTPEECQEALDEQIAGAIDDYVARWIGDHARGQVVLPADYVRRFLIKDQWLEKINTSLGEMYNLHALLAFNRQIDGRLRDAWNETVAAARLVLAVFVFLGTILPLSVIYGYLRIDQATGGVYRRRLRLAAAGILILIAAGAVYALT